MSNFLVGGLRQDEEDLYQLVIYQRYENAPWPPVFQLDGYDWEFKGPGFMTLEEDARFAAKGIYKVVVPEPLEDEQSKAREDRAAAVGGVTSTDSGDVGGDEGTPERPSKDTREGTGESD